MAGIGIRFFELARRLAAAGFEVTLIQPGDPALVPELPLAAVKTFERGRLRELLAGVDVVISQGQLANDVVVEVPELPTVLDFYDPFLIENMHYLPTLGLDPYRNDHATFVLQLSRGDFFLCSCEEQRLFYTGFLAALGRVHPQRLATDPDLQQLVAVVPFGVPAELPPYRALLPARAPGEKRLLFGGLYDWYDPWPLLRAVAAETEQRWTLLLIRNPNAGTPQKLLAEVETWARKRELWGTKIQALDWVPAERRYDLLAEVDVLAASHRRDFETRLSLRTRFLDALAVGCPVLTSEGGAIARLLAADDAGWVVPEGDEVAIGRALHEIFAGGPTVAAKAAAARHLATSFHWEKVLEPLIAFCREPRRDAAKDDFAFRPPTRTPADPLSFRIRRKLRGLFGSAA
jgi:glycosyltransferase involved in cell wall biosynthesis